MPRPPTPSPQSCLAGALFVAPSILLSSFLPACLLPAKAESCFLKAQGFGPVRQPPAPRIRGRNSPGLCRTLTAPMMLNSPPISPATRGASTHGTFSGHETFVFRYGWLKKGLEGLRERPDIFSAEEAVARLGVGKNMVRSIRHWCLATRLLAEEDGRRGGLTESAFGRFLLSEADPYLEHEGSLWLLHWHLATNADRATTWYWAFNVQREAEWTRETLQARLTQWAEAQGWARLSAASLKADVSCFVRSYVPGRRGPASTPEETLDCPLATLGLITEVEGDKRYRFNTRPKPTLPPSVFIYALWRNLSWNVNGLTFLNLPLSSLLKKMGTTRTLTALRAGLSEFGK